MIYKNFKTIGGKLVIHKDNLEAARHELETAIRELLLDELWMSGDLKLTMEGPFIRLSLSVCYLPESEEDVYDTDCFPLLDWYADIIKDMDASGCLTFTVLLAQSIPVVEGSGRTVEEVISKEFQLSIND